MNISSKYLHFLIHYTNNPVLEAGNFGAYIHRANSFWES